MKKLALIALQFAAVFLSTQIARAGYDKNVSGVIFDDGTRQTTAATGGGSSSGVSLSTGVFGLLSVSTQTIGAFLASATVNGSLLLTGPNNQNNASPIFGVNSGSVAVLQGGNVANFQIDGSSITKQGVATAGQNISITNAASKFTVALAGIVPAANIPSTVTYTNASNLFTATQTFTMGLVTSTLAITSLSPGVMHTIAGSSQTATFQVSPSSEIAPGNLPSTVMASSFPAVIPAGTYGSATISPTITVNAQGQVVGLSSNTISGGAGDMVLASTQTSGGAKKWTSYSDFIGSATFNGSVLATNITALSTTTLNGILVVKASSTFNGELGVVTTSTSPSTIGSGLIVGGHIEVSSTTPALSSCGTSPSIVGTDVAGTITVGSVSASSCVMTFAAPWPNKPSCGILSNTAIVSPTGSTTPTAFTFGGTAITSDVVMYQCLGYR